MNNTALNIFIVIAVYIIAEIIKGTVMKEGGKHYEHRSILPVICMAIGGIIGVLLFVLYPVGINVADAVNAFVIGALSGLAATGSNQLYKHIMQFRNPNAAVDEYNEESSKDNNDVDP